MSVYRLELSVSDPEVTELPPMPVWDDLDLSLMLASFHDWMNNVLTAEQRLAVRWHLTPE